MPLRNRHRQPDHVPYFTLSLQAIPNTFTDKRFMDSIVQDISTLKSEKSKLRSNLALGFKMSEVFSPLKLISVMKQEK